MLTQESQHIVSFLLKHYKIKKIKLSPESIDWISVLFKKIKCVKMSKLETEQLVKCSSLNQSQYYNNQFIADNIKSDISKNKDCQIYSILNTTIVISKDWLCDINLQHITNIISIMRHLSGKKGHILINIWNTPHKKHLPHRCNKLEPVNVNSGSTLPGEFINLWRNEEFNKVLIHELIHTFFLDFRDSCNIENYVRTTFSISSDSPVYIWESYTEFLAIIIHAIYISKNVKNVINLLSVEKYFGYLQCAKILHQFGCDSSSDLLNKKCTLSYVTDILSYFNIKTSMLHMLDESIKYMIKYNTNIVNFNENHCKEYLDLIKISMNNSSFINIIDTFIKKIPHITDSIMKSTMRMTAIEIK